MRTLGEPAMALRELVYRGIKGESAKIVESSELTVSASESLLSSKLPISRQGFPQSIHRVSPRLNAQPISSGCGRIMSGSDNH